MYLTARLQALRPLRSRPSSSLISQPRRLSAPSLAATRRAPVRPANVFPFDQAWSPSVDPTALAALAPQLFAVSLFPYLGFLYHLTRSGKAPKLTLIGFYFLLAFVGATIPAGIYGARGVSARCKDR